MKSWIRATTFLFVALSVCGASAQEPAPAEPPELEFHLPLPEGWRSETIPFPLSFAPELDYEGLEELRFAPGMFDAESEDLWTYAFIWWVPADTEFTAERLSRDLTAYFRGLQTAVAEGRGGTVGDARFSSDLAELPSEDGGNRLFEGTAETFDAFVSQGQIELGVRVEILPCSAEGKVAAFFELSPQEAGHPVWTELAAIREGFECSADGAPTSNEPR